MAKYAKVKIGSYRRRDGSKIKAHTKRVKVNRGTVSRLKELRNHFKGKLHTARREGHSKKALDRMKARIRQMTRDINTVKLGNRKYKQGIKYQKRRKGIR